MAHVAEFLIALAEQTDIRSSFDRDPRQAMDDFGLTLEEQEAVLSGDERAMMKFCGNPQAKVVTHTEDDDVADAVVAKIVTHTEDDEVHAKIVSHTEEDDDRICAKQIWATEEPDESDKKAA